MHIWTAHRVPNETVCSYFRINHKCKGKCKGSSVFSEFLNSRNLFNYLLIFTRKTGSMIGKEAFCNDTHKLKVTSLTPEVILGILSIMIRDHKVYHNGVERVLILVPRGPNNNIHFGRLLISCLRAAS